MVKIPLINLRGISINGVNCWQNPPQKEIKTVTSTTKERLLNLINQYYCIINEQNEVYK